MADDKEKEKKVPLPPPIFGAALASPGGPASPPPGLPSFPGAPFIPGPMSASGPSAPPPLPGAPGGFPHAPAGWSPFPSPAARPPAAPPGPGLGAPQAPAAAAQALEQKVAELEKRLQQEREKVLLAQVRSQEEATYAAKVETAIKDVQDKLRRDRRDAEQEEGKLKLETRIQELETRLAQERETWVSTLKGQVRTREVQDKEIETHFAMRLQEMERRWLEEKAHWQRAVLAKEDEARTFRVQAERLKGVELEQQKLAQEKKLSEERAAALQQELGSAQARLKGTEERERDYFQLKAELVMAREQSRVLQDRLERDVQGARMAGREREERLLAENERLQREIVAVAERVRHEMDLEVKKAKADAVMVQGALQRLKAVAGAFERQVAALRAQAEEGAKARRDLERGNERYKAEFLVLQRRWQDRERELRSEFDAEKVRMQLRFQEDLRRELERGLAARPGPPAPGPPAPEPPAPPRLPSA